MAEKTNISWTDATFNPWRGCTKVSPGCANCYADKMSKRNPGTLGVWGPNGTRVVAAEAYWRQPIKWDRDAKAAGGRKRVFCASLADVFEDWQGPMLNTSGQQLSRLEGACEVATTMTDVRRRLFNLIDQTPNLDWLLLTKRPENVRRMWPERICTRCFWGPCDLNCPENKRHRKNVWIGTSISDQATANDFIAEILKCWDLSPVLFLSIEPMLGAVDFSAIPTDIDIEANALTGVYRQWCDEGVDHPGAEQFYDGGPKIGWVIVGGESGPNARPFDLAWARSIRDQCKAAGVKFFFKQAGSNPIDEEHFAKAAAWFERQWGFPPGLPNQIAECRLKFRDRAGAEPTEWPEDLRIQEFPR